MPDPRLPHIYGSGICDEEVEQVLRGSCGDTRLAKLSRGQLLGRYFATTRQRLREVADRLGLRRVPNLGGCPAS